MAWKSQVNVHLIDAFRQLIASVAGKREYESLLINSSNSLNFSFSSDIPNQSKTTASFLKILVPCLAFSISSCPFDLNRAESGYMFIKFKIQLMFGGRIKARLIAYTVIDKHFLLS